jgi:MoaA/NifB/PqqE/SkfB family radical SAM enzyme
MIQEALAQPPSSFKPSTPSTNYIMRGSAATRALDVYHLILAPTHACNLRCKHCYLPDHDADLLSKEIALRLVDEWSDIVLEERGVFQGVFHVKGGEPFVVPYIADIMARLAELASLRLMLTTNGTLVKSRMMERLRMCNEHLSGHITVVVSLDGASASSHEALRGAGQFTVTMSFLEDLQRFGIQTFLNCVLHDGNLHEVDDYLLLAKRLGVSQINFLPLVPKGYGKAIRGHQVPHFRVHAALQRAFDDGDRETRELLAGSLPDIIDREKQQHFCCAKECVAAYRGLLYIKPDGSVFSCPNLEDQRYSVGNVHRDPLRGVLDKLNVLYGHLHATNMNDRYLCTGERKRYEAENDTINIRSLGRLQAAIQGREGPELADSSKDIAFCVSRNW